MMKNLADASGRVLLDSECITYLVEQVAVSQLSTECGSDCVSVQVSQILCDCPVADSQEEEEDQLQIAKKAVKLLKVRQSHFCKYCGIMFMCDILIPGSQLHIFVTITENIYCCAISITLYSCVVLVCYIDVTGFLISLS